MQQTLFRLGSIVLIIASAAIAAFWLAHLAHSDFGFATYRIRDDALVSASLVFGILVIGLLSNRLGRRGR
ncbi:MAG: hypothetical protein ACREDL_21395 [Bradyrhizobium sp.]